MLSSEYIFDNKNEIEGKPIYLDHAREDKNIYGYVKSKYKNNY